jgi:hypothetical protein
MFMVLNIGISQKYVMPNEKSVFEFNTLNNKHLVIAIEFNEEYLIYRFGTNDSIEFIFPENKITSWLNFKYYWYLRGGGKQNEGLDLNYLSFENDDYQYIVYEEFSAQSNISESGLKIINKNTQQEVILLADTNSIKGSLIYFRNLSKIQTD